MTTWSAHYQPPHANVWQGRADAPENSSFFQIMQFLDLSKNIATPKTESFALIGFCCDEGIRRNLGRVGAAEGPKIIREVLAKLPVQKQNFVCFDAGDITCTDGDLESAQEALAESVALLLKHNITPIVLGGGHEVAWGHYQGIAKQFPQEKLGIVNIDAHFDMRPLNQNKGNSGTPFLQIAQAHENTNRAFNYNCIGIQKAGNIQPLFDTAKKYHAQILWADDLHQGDINKCNEFITRIIQQNQLIYLSLCLDVFAAPFAPGVSAPQALGLIPWQVIPLVRKIAASGKVVSYDIAELSPQYDRDYRTAKLAANFIYEIIHNHQAR